MKRLLISSIIFTILILASCAPAPTATIAPSETPTLVPTSTSTPTQTPESPLPTEAPAESDLRPLLKEFTYDPERADVITKTFMGVEMTTIIVSDSTLYPIISNKIDITGTGELDTTEVVARSLYKGSLAKGGPDGTGIKNDDGSKPTLEQYIKMLKEAREGIRPWTDVQLIIDVDYEATTKYSPQKAILFPMYNSDKLALDDVVTFNEIIYNFMDDGPSAHNVKQEGDFSYSTGVSVFENKLVVNISVDANKLKNQNTLISFISSLGNILATGKSVRDTSLDNIISPNSVIVN